MEPGRSPHFVRATGRSDRYRRCQGSPEQALIVTPQVDRRLTSAEILHLSTVRVPGTWQTFSGRLHHEGIALWVGAERVFPFTAHDQAAREYWMHHGQVVDRILRERGWPLGGKNDIGIPILVADDHRIGTG